MIDHGVHIARGDQEGQAGTAQAAEAVRNPPVRLGDHPDSIAPVFQQTGDQSGAEGGVIHISITGYEDEVELTPSPLERLFPGYRKKSVHVEKYTAAEDRVTIAFTKQCQNLQR